MTRRSLTFRVILATIFGVGLVCATAWFAMRRYDASANPAAASARGMVRVAGGQHLVGALIPAAGDLKARWLTMPSFAIARFPVTTQQLIGYSRHSSAFGWRPTAAQYASAVPFELAEAFCKHLHAALPTESQWDYAVRGGDGRTYPWGNGAPAATVNDIGPFGVAAAVTHGGEWVRRPLRATAPGKAIVRGAPPKGSHLAGRVNDRSETFTGTRPRRDVGFRCAAFQVSGPQ